MCTCYNIRAKGMHSGNSGKWQGCCLRNKLGRRNSVTNEIHQRVSIWVSWILLKLLDSWLWRTRRDSKSVKMALGLLKFSRFWEDFHESEIRLRGYVTDGTNHILCGIRRSTNSETGTFSRPTGHRMTGSLAQGTSFISCFQLGV